MLIDKIIKLFENKRLLSDWQMANLIYDNCMNIKAPANGARISNIRRACHKSDRIAQAGNGYILLGNTGLINGHN